MDFYAHDAIQCQFPVLSQDLHGCTQLLMIWTLLHRNVVANYAILLKVCCHQKSVAESGVLNGHPFIEVAYYCVSSFV